MTLLEVTTANGCRWILGHGSVPGYLVVSVILAPLQINEELPLKEACLLDLNLPLNPTRQLGTLSGFRLYLVQEPANMLFAKFGPELGDGLQMRWFIRPGSESSNS
jgi:hypothetical protein